MVKKMKPELKKRIDQLNNGEVPDGYKRTEFGVFPCDWETDKTFGDLFNFYGGLGKSREELSENGIPYLHYGDMHRGEFNMVSYKQYNTLPKYDTQLSGNETYLMDDGDVAFLDASEDLEGTSRAVLIDNPGNKPFIAGLHIIYGKPNGKELSKYYKQYLTQSEYVKKQFQKLASGFKVYGVNRNSITKIKCAYPADSKEQEKIAEILMKWDEAIELQGKYIEKLNVLKSVYLKNMFPRKKEKKPCLRFLKFTEDWEQRKFSDLAETRRGLTYSPENIVENGIRVLRSSNINEDTFVYGNEDVFVDENAVNIPCVKSGDILITSANGSSRLVGKHAIIKDLPTKSAVHGGFMLVASCEKPEFVNALMGAPWYSSFINLFVAGGNGAIGNLSKSDLDDQVVYVPDSKEQDAIGSFFDNLDNLITLHQRKLEKLIFQRKVLQQYLLNGIVRV